MFIVLIKDAWQHARQKYSAYALGAALYFVFFSTLLAASFGDESVFWLSLRSGVLANTLAIFIFAVALFIDKLRESPGPLREAAANPSVGFDLRLRSADILQRSAVLLQY